MLLGRLLRQLLGRRLGRSFVVRAVVGDAVRAVVRAVVGDAVRAVVTAAVRATVREVVCC